jgi:phospholipid transport system substrate-binding protein
MTIRTALAVSVAVCLLLGGGRAQAKESGATAQVRQVLDKAMEIQTREDLGGDGHRNERAKLVHELIDANFSSSDMAKEALSDNWEALSAQQRTEFVALFTRLFQASYTRMVLNFLQRESVEYREEETGKAGATRVSTVIKRANEHIPVDYILAPKGGRWLITDVVIDGVSIVENYRNSFGRVIRASSFASLIEKMRLQSKAEQEDAS